MKKISFIIIFLVLGILLTSCGLPDSHKEVQPYCRAQYEILLSEYPDYPPSFVGACISYFQTGKYSAFVSLCGYEPLWAEINDSEGTSITSKQECIYYFKNLD